MKKKKGRKTKRGECFPLSNYEMEYKAKKGIIYLELPQHHILLHWKYFNAAFYFNRTTLIPHFTYIYWDIRDSY
jgi:hypothetical protein